MNTEYVIASLGKRPLEGPLRKIAGREACLRPIAQAGIGLLLPSVEELVTL